MTKIKNVHHHSDDPEQLKFWAEELDFIGRDYRLDLKNKTLTVFALPRRHKKSKDAKSKRNKKAESAGRRL